MTAFFKSKFMYLFLNDECHQGRAKWRNCRLSTETPDYQLGWAVLAASRLMDTLKRNFHSPNLTCFITLEVHTGGPRIV